MKNLLACVLTIALASCAGSSANTGSSNAEVVTGGERLGWDQQAGDAGDLATFGYALYVDSVRSQAVDVMCDQEPVSGRFPCTCALPRLQPGTHTLQISAFVTDAGVVHESDRSAPLVVIAR